MIRYEMHQYFCLFLNGYKLVAAIKLRANTPNQLDFYLIDRKSRLPILMTGYFINVISSINNIAILYDLITIVHVIVM